MMVGRYSQAPNLPSCSMRLPPGLVCRSDALLTVILALYHMHYLRSTTPGILNTSIGYSE